MLVATNVILWHGFSVESLIGELKRDPVSGKASGRDRMTPDDAQGIAEVSQVVDIKCHQMLDIVKLKWCITNICFEIVTRRSLNSYVLRPWSSPILHTIMAEFLLKSATIEFFKFEKNWDIIFKL